MLVQRRRRWANVFLIVLRMFSVCWEGALGMQPQAGWVRDIHVMVILLTELYAKSLRKQS